MSDNKYIDDEELRRRQEARRRKRKAELEKQKKRNRIIITGVAVVILLIIIFLFGSCVCNGCSNSNNGNNYQDATTAQPNGEGTTQVAVDATTAELPTEVQTTAVNEIADNGEDGYEVSGIYIWNNQAFELFYGGEDAARNYANAISTYRLKLDANVNVYNMVVPTHVAFGLPARLESTVGSGNQRDYLNTIYSSYTASGIQSINIFDKMNEHKTEYLFFNTDHHWTGLGTYYAYQQFCSAVGETPVDINTLTPHSIEGFVGSLYTATESEVLKNNSDTVTYYDMPTSYTMEIMQSGSDEFVSLDSMYYEDASAGSDTYGAFIWGDNPVTRIKNAEPKNGRKILVIKESYGNAFVPWLINNYDEVHAIDFRHYEGNVQSYCSENGITDVLFINGVMSSATSFQIDSMDGIFN